MVIYTESSDFAEYLCESDVINFSYPAIQAIISKLFNNMMTDIEKVQVAFEFVRDDIAHSWDVQSTRVTCKASDVLLNKEGICYAKSNLLAAILRAIGIPAGFCYQRLMLFDTPEKGFCIHALNAVYLQELKKWIRLDARGNKPGVQAEFSVHEEKLAFTIQAQFGEINYPIIFTAPNEKTISTLQSHTDALDMYLHHLPSTL